MDRLDKDIILVGPGFVERDFTLSRWARGDRTALTPGPSPGGRGEVAVGAKKAPLP